MIRITIEREKIIKSLKELEREYNTGKIPERHYNAQKRRLTEQLETFEVAERVRRLQGKETTEVPVDDSIEEEEQENEELFKKYITSPGLKEKKLQSEKKGMSQNRMIAYALLAGAFIIGIGFGIFTLDLPTDASSASLYTNDSAFPPYVVNNTTNMTNTTNITKNLTNTTKKLNTTVTKPKTTTPTIKKNTTPTTNESDTPPAAGDPSETKPNTKSGNTSG